LANGPSEADAFQRIADLTRPYGDTITSEKYGGIVIEGTSHPTGFVPGRPLPPEFPLDERGELTCSTCHGLLDGTQTGLRTDKTGAEFCGSCHDSAFFSQMADGGRSLFPSGHLDADRSTLGPVDGYSMKCMNCHSDEATISGTKTVPRSFMLPVIGGTNHPIGADYARFESQHGYNPASSLSRDILLPDDRVSCLSCHEGYSRQHGKVVQFDTLCTQCHDK
jgi:hypothetical protein